MQTRRNGFGGAAAGALSLALVVGAFGVVVPVSPALAQQEESTEQMSNEQLLRDFAFFVTIRQDELALAHANELLRRGLSADEFVGLVEDSGVEKKFERAIRTAMQAPQLEGIAAQLNNLFEEGHRARARNPQEISRNIQLLTQNPRARLLARERLLAAREYAVPQLLEVLMARSDQALEGHVERLLVEMGGNAVMPLCAALDGADETTQERIAKILGEIHYPSARASLYDLLQSTRASTVRDACIRAIAQIQGNGELHPSVAELYYQLAEDYYRSSPSLIRFPGEDFQLLWTFDPGIGLYPTAIRTEVFGEARAMELAEKAIQLDDDHERALSLWLAANMSRDINQPSGYENPVYPDDRKSALFYMVMAGSEASQRVLARAIADADTPLMRRTIEALSRSAGGASLWEGLGSQRPLLDALSYPDRRVQFEAALAIGKAKPRAPFAGSDRVTPILASAVRHASARYALVLADSANRRDELHQILESLGYTVLQSGTSISDMAAVISEAPGVDMVVSDLPRSGSLSLIDDVRSTPKLSVTPILAILPGSAWTELISRFATDPLTDVRSRGVSASQISISIEQLALSATGPAVDEVEAEVYALSALSVLRDLAISRNPVLRADDAEASLILALDETSGQVRLSVADVLARIDSGRSQRALAEAMFDATGDDQLDLIQRVSESAKNFGNLLEPRQQRRLIEMIDSGADEIATASASLVGTLNLSERNLSDLILD